MFRSRKNSRTLSIEPLESRQLLTACSTEVTATMERGNLEIEGTCYRDEVTLNIVGNTLEVKWQTSPPTGVKRDVEPFPLEAVKQITFRGYAEDDRFSNPYADRPPALGILAVPFDLDGGDGKDRLQGGSGPDVIRGGDHNDKLYGGQGDDWLFGEGGNGDVLNGEAGSDFLDAGSVNRRDKAKGAGSRANPEDLDFDAWRPVVNQATRDDVLQNGAVCRFAAILAAIAGDGNQSLADGIRYKGSGVYQVMFPGKGREVEVELFDVANREYNFDDSDPRPRDNPKTADFWPLLYYKAFEELHPNEDDWTPTTIYRAFGYNPYGRTRGVGEFFTDAHLKRMKGAIDADRPVVVGVPPGGFRYPGWNSTSVDDLLIRNHAYTVVSIRSARTSNEYQIELRNPHGRDNYSGEPFVGREDDGLITLNWGDLRNSISGIFIGY